MKQRLLALALAITMLSGMVPALGAADEAAKETAAAEAKETEEAEEAEKAEEATESKEKVLIDWNCDILDTKIVNVSNNQYPNFYFVDSRFEGAEEGTVRMSGDEKSTEYATLVMNPQMTTAAFTLEMDMRIDALVTPASAPMYRGLIIELELPDNKLIYMVLQDLGETDENGKNATLRVSKLDRGSDTTSYDERIYIPTDDEFHTWAFQYDGVDMLRVTLDGEVVKDFPGVNTFYNSKDTFRFMLKNIMMNRTEDSTLNDVTFDRIKLTEGTELNYVAFQSAAPKADATADKFTVQAVLNRLEKDGEVTMTVYPRGEEDKAVTTTFTPEETSFDITAEKLPFTGMCTVQLEYPGALPYTFNCYLYRSFETVEKDAKIKADTDGKAYVLYDLKDAKLSEDSAWYTLGYESETISGTALCIAPLSTEMKAELPLTLTGKYAVYVGYAEENGAVSLNGTAVSFTAEEKADGRNIKEAYVTAVDLDGESVSLTNVPNESAKIAYVKFVSLTDEQYDIATREDNTHTFITDNDGFSTLCNKNHGDYDTLFNNDFLSRTEAIDQRQFIWCTFSTSILNYDSEVWWKHVTARLKELGIPEDKWPEDFLDHVDVKGNHIDFDAKMRTSDKNAYNNMRALNETGYPHKVLSDMVAEEIEGSEFYVSLRMSHFADPDGAFAFHTGTYAFLHPDWKRGGSDEFSYMHDEYRQYLHDILIEMAEPENVTGVLMDFGRYYLIFGTELTDVEKRTEIMNGFVESVHKDMPEGKKITVRVLDPIPEKATAWGLDYKTWVKEGWVDRVYISCQGHETFFDFDEYIEFFEDYPDVEFYLGINASLSGHDPTKEEEEILAAGGEVQGWTTVGVNDFLLRAYDFYAAGADGVLAFNWREKDPVYTPLNNATLMKQWYYFTYPAELAGAHPVLFTDEGGERVILDYDCASLDVSAVSVTNNQHPNFYFADHTTEETVPEGQIYIGGEAKEKTGYVTMNVPLEGIGKAYTLSMDMNVESLMQPTKASAWRGLIFEVTSPGAPLLYFTLHGMDKDAAGNNATLLLSKKTRGAADVKEKIKVPTDGKMHTWTVDFDGKGAVVFKIDGKEILKADGIVAEPQAITPILQIKNMMTDIGSSYNSVYIDRIGVTSVVEAVSAEDAQKEAEKAEVTAAKATLETRAEVLELPVADDAWAKAPTIEQSENPTNYKRYGKEAEVEYAYDAEAKTLTLHVTYNLNSWLYDMALTDKDGKEIEFKTDRTYGKPRSGNTLWSHSYAESDHADAVKTVKLVIENVTEMPEKYVFYASNCGTGTVFTAKITIEFPAE